MVRENLVTLYAAVDHGFASALPPFVRDELEGYVACECFREALPCTWRARSWKHGGTIAVTSEVGKGSTFVLELPPIADPSRIEQGNAAELRSA